MGALFIVKGGQRRAIAMGRELSYVAGDILAIFLVFSVICSFLVLVTAGALMISFQLVRWPCWGGSIVIYRGSFPTPFGHWILLEPERDFPGSLPLRPMFEEGVSILNTDVVILSESVTARQVLGEYEVVLGFSQLSPWDPSFAATGRNL